MVRVVCVAKIFRHLSETSLHFNVLLGDANEAKGSGVGSGVPAAGWTDSRVSGPVLTHEST